ncbi:hypothetical protein LY78DRAFT_469997 [Colletotrichum sublineola]|nr:hypothetical protein LY78DRAFT_469997 [Colletotrichum sublineola]
MAAQQRLDPIAQARVVVRAADEKYQKVIGKVFFQAAKEARKWYISKKLAPAVIYESGKAPRQLRRF